MAEPTNTPLPTAPGTPISATPRSASPTHPHHHPAAFAHHPPPLPQHLHFRLAHSSSRNKSADHGPSSGSGPGPGLGADPSKPVVLHIGDPVHFNPQTFAEFSQHFTIIRPTLEERQRDAFKQALRDRRWGDFHAIFRPFWSTGGEMGPWDRELIDLLPASNSVRVFASAGAGFDWVDTKGLGERGVIYCNASRAAAESVADFAVAMIISTFRMLPWCMSAASASASDDREEAFQECHVAAPGQSHTLRGHTLGVIGLGNIGQSIALKCGLAFGMKILYHDVEQKPADLEARLSAQFRPTMEDLVAQSDCVVLAIPSAPSAPDNNPDKKDTKNPAAQVVTASLLTHFPHGSRFVNVARGSLVDESALADALNSGQLSNVALDVHAEEPRVHPRLRAHAGKRAMLTCHNAGGTVEAHAGFEELAMRNVLDVLVEGGSGRGLTGVNLQWLK